MQRRTALMLPALAALAALGAAACREPDCLEGGACEETAPCAALVFNCEARDQVSITQLQRAEGVAGDLMLRNARVTLVLDALDEPHDLAPTGGNIIGFGPTGGGDDVNLVYQLAGILPDDAFAYDSLEIIDRAPDFVAAVLRGHLDGRSDVEVATRYELHRCEPGVRVRSELRNRSPDAQVFIVADGAHWGKRRVLPFTSREGEGWLQPELDLIELEESWATFPYVAARTPRIDAPGYGFVRCDADRLEGVNDPEISALGTARTLVRPGERLVLERFLAAGDLPETVAVLRQVREQMHGDRGAVRRVRAQVWAGDPYYSPLVKSVVVSEWVGGTLIPVTASSVDQSFDLPVGEGALQVELWQFGRPAVTVEAPAGTDDVDLGQLRLPEPALLELSVHDAAEPIPALVVVQPADAAEAERLRGTFHGRFTPCSPWLGPPHGASPACNRVLLANGSASVQVPAGRYLLYATAGPERTIARRELTVEGGQTHLVDFTLQPLDIRPAGWLSADLHVHGRASFDSGIPDQDRLDSFLAAGIDVIAATDHDFVTDYETGGAYGDVRIIGGLETTQLIPWMDVPGDDFPRVIGHFNFWPLQPDPASPRGGAPWDERIEPGELFDIMDGLVGDDGLMMLNHPWDDTQFGRDLGYLRAINFDPRLLIPEEDDGSAQGMLVRRPAAGHRNVDFDVIEVMNGASAVNLVRTRPLWFSLLSQGYVKAGAANSDSHGLTDAQIGYARTLVDADTTVDTFDPALFNQAVRDGRSLGGNGVVVLVTVGRVDRTRPSLTPYVPGEGDWIDIEVRAPPWIPVTEVRLTTSAGTVVVAEGGALTQPADPFGTEGVVRIQWARPLTDIIPGRGDDWIVVEAGLPLPPAADLDDDGVPDTGDNDGDGDVDDDDIEPGEDSGPHDPPPDPTDPADPRFVCTQVIPGLWPAGFANPLLIDWDGDGWTPPGIR